MTRRLLGALFATLACGTLTVTGVASAAPAPSAQPEAHSAPDYTGIIALDNCSGALVRLPSSKDTDPALAMTNAHCNESGMPGPGTVIVDEPSNRSMNVLGADGQEIGSVTATKIAYGTMTDTDMMIYELDQTYADISSEFGGTALEMATERPADGAAISVVSGYFAEKWSCNIDKFIFELKEADWTWKDSMRYTPECETKHGTSGSPVIDNETNKVVGVNNTGNDDGEKCTMNNPCEVDENGNIDFEQGRHYGQQTYLFGGCVGEGNKVDLSKAECKLPKPNGEARIVAPPLPPPA